MNCTRNQLQYRSKKINWMNFIFSKFNYLPNMTYSWSYVRARPRLQPKGQNYKKDKRVTMSFDSWKAPLKPALTKRVEQPSSVSLRNKIYIALQIDSFVQAGRRAVLPISCLHRIRKYKAIDCLKGSLLADEVQPRAEEATSHIVVQVTFQMMKNSVI